MIAQGLVEECDVHRWPFPLLNDDNGERSPSVRPLARLGCRVSHTEHVRVTRQRTHVCSEDDRTCGNALDLGSTTAGSIDVMGVSICDGASCNCTALTLPPLLSCTRYCAPFHLRKTGSVQRMRHSGEGRSSAI